MNSLKRHSQPERDYVQKPFYDWICLSPPYRRAYIPSPNGGRRSVIEGARQKGIFIRKGVWDVFMAIPVGRYHGFFIEFKWGKNKLTKEQEEFGFEMTLLGYLCKVYWDWEKAKDDLIAYTWGAKLESDV